MNEQVTDQAAAVLRFRRLVELIADPDEHWQYRNGEPMAPDATAFLEYLRGVEQRLVAAEEALDALKAGDAVGASTITQFLGARADLKITMTAIPWGENGLLEAPVILATIGDYLGHIFYTERSTTVEVALRALSAQITQSVEATEDKHHE